VQSGPSSHRAAWVWLATALPLTAARAVSAMGFERGDDGFKNAGRTRRPKNRTENKMAESNEHNRSVESRGAGSSALRPRQAPFAGPGGAQRISACRTAARDRRCGQPVDTWPMLSIVPSSEILANARDHKWIARLPEDRALAQQPYKTKTENRRLSREESSMFGSCKRGCWSRGSISSKTPATRERQERWFRPIHIRRLEFGRKPKRNCIAPPWLMAFCKKLRKTPTLLFRHSGKHGLRKRPAGVKAESITALELRLFQIALGSGSMIWHWLGTPPRNPRYSLSTEL
jgi:hypothetical protein